jgi:hypothetical protein
MVFENYASTFLSVKFRQNNKNLKIRQYFVTIFPFSEKKFTKFGKKN